MEYKRKEMESQKNQSDARELHLKTEQESQKNKHQEEMESQKNKHND